MSKKLVQNSGFKLIFVILIPALILVYCGFGVSNYYLSLITLFMINVVLTASLNLTNGFTGIFNMGAAGFMAIGAYVSSLLTLAPETKSIRIEGIPGWLANIQLPFWIAIIIAGLIAALVAALVGFPVLRAKGHYLSVMTLGMIVIIKSVIDNNTSITNGAKGISGMDNYSTYGVVVFITLLTLYILYRITKSSFGRNMIAIRDDEAAAVSLGINAAKYKIMSFAISAFFAAVGGAMWAHLQRTIAPSFFYFDETFAIVEMSVLGGMFCLSGSIPGAAILTFLPQMLSKLEGGFLIGSFAVPPLYGLSKIIMSVIFILVILFRRQGIMGRKEYIIDSWFNPKVYKDLVKKDTWKELCGIVTSMFKHTAK